MPAKIKEAWFSIPRTFQGLASEIRRRIWLVALSSIEEAHVGVDTSEASSIVDLVVALRDALRKPKGD